MSDHVEYEWMAAYNADGDSCLLLITDDMRVNHPELLDDVDARTKWVCEHGTGWNWPEESFDAE